MWKILGVAKQYPTESATPSLSDQATVSRAIYRALEDDKSVSPETAGLP